MHTADFSIWLLLVLYPWVPAPVASIDLFSSFLSCCDAFKKDAWYFKSAKPNLPESVGFCPVLCSVCQIELKECPHPVTA